jgi:hypothetical protein
MRLRIVLFAFFLCLFTIVTAKSWKAFAEVSDSGNNTGAVLSVPRWGKIVNRNTLPMLPMKKDRNVFVKMALSGHEFMLPDKFFISGNDIYRVQIPTARSTGIASAMMRYDITILEFGSSLIKIRGDVGDLLVEVWEYEAAKMGTNTQRIWK